MNKITKTKAIFLYALVASFLIFEMGVQVSPSIMTSQLMADLNIGTFGLGLISGVYFYTYAFFQTPSGILFDNFNPRKIIAFSIITCSLGSLAFGLSPNVIVSALARLLMGAGSAFAFVSVLVVTADLFHNKYFAFITGITQMLAALGAMSGQIPLSKLVNVIGWRHTMVVLAMIGFVLALLIWIFLTYQKEHHLSSEESLPLLKSLKQIIRHRQTWVIAIYACLLWAPMSGFASLWGVPFLMSAYHLSHTEAATLTAFMWLGLALFSPILGYWSTAIERRVLPLALSAFVGFLAFAFVLFDLTSPIWLLGLFLFLAGGACSGQALSFSVIRENNDPRQRATAIAINNMAVVLSGAFFQPMIGRLLEFFKATAIGQEIHCSIQGYQYSLLMILLSYFIGALIALFFIKETFAKEITSYQSKT